MPARIYHNPNCGTSRNTLAMIQASGETPEIIEYLKTPPAREALLALLAAMNISVHAARMTMDQLIENCLPPLLQAQADLRAVL